MLHYFIVALLDRMELIMGKLVNLMENVVTEKINEFLPNTKYCQCEQCKMDIAAYALNQLPPRYVHTLDKAIIQGFVSATPQNEVEVTACVYRAIQFIGEAPNHQ